MFADYERLFRSCLRALGVRRRIRKAESDGVLSSKFLEINMRMVVRVWTMSSNGKLCIRKSLSAFQHSENNEGNFSLVESIPRNVIPSHSCEPEEWSIHNSLWEFRLSADFQRCICRDLNRFTMHFREFE